MGARQVGKEDAKVLTEVPERPRVEVPDMRRERSAAPTTEPCAARSLLQESRPSNCTYYMYMGRGARCVCEHQLVPAKVLARVKADLARAHDRRMIKFLLRRQKYTSQKMRKATFG